MYIYLFFIAYITLSNNYVLKPVYKSYTGCMCNCACMLTFMKSSLTYYHSGTQVTGILFDNEKNPFDI